MDKGIMIPDGSPLYSVGKLINDFETIFCHALNNSIYFVGARNHLKILLNIHNNTYLSSNKYYNWNHKYAFKSDELKRNIDWFRNRSNSNKRERLIISPSDQRLFIRNAKVNAELNSYVKNPPIPKVPEMRDGVFARIPDLKGIVDQIRPIDDEVINLRLSDSTLTISGLTHKSPEYKIHITQNLENDEKSTYCLKPMLLKSFELASDLGRTDLRFYPGGAIQLSSKGNYLSVRCLLTTINASNTIA